MKQIDAAKRKNYWNIFRSIQNEKNVLIPRSKRVVGMGARHKLWKWKSFLSLEHMRQKWNRNKCVTATVNKSLIRKLSFWGRAGTEASNFNSRINKQKFVQLFPHNSGGSILRAAKQKRDLLVKAEISVR